MTIRPLLPAMPVNTLLRVAATGHPAARWRAYLLCGLGFALGLVLAGCSSPVPERFYTLAPLAKDVSPLRTDSATTSPQAPVVRIWVAPSRLPTVLDREQWVVRRGGTELQILEQHRWGQGLRDEIDQALADHLGMALRQQMPPQADITVTTSRGMPATQRPGAMPANSSTLNLYMEVLRFDTLLQPRPQIQDELRWTLRCVLPDTNTGVAKPPERSGVFQSGLREAKSADSPVGEEATPHNAVVASHSQSLQSVGMQIARAVAGLASLCSEQPAAVRQP